MEVRVFLSQGEIELDSWKDCHYSVSYHHLAVVAVAYVAVAPSVRVAVSAAAAGPAVGLGRRVPAAES